MRVFAVLFAIVGVSIAASVGGPDATAEVIKSELDNIGVDGFKFAYETSNGIVAEETGQLKNVGTDDESLAVQGSFKYIAPDGVTYQVSYIADENGYQPQGAHLPVSS